ncbi:hypothetical protein HNR37_002188 [Desulfurispira natronophila]|uniref:Uncharacterized protein n=1 Tax=Desulfurispira natronophila TaxID=682562 RepID=A0A7W7Y670_9BACT|nr:hypothetical protein [Desulfurispira natronophila]
MKFLIKFANNAPKRARVVPVLLRRINPSESTSEFLHWAYFQLRDEKLANFIRHSSKTASHRQYSLYYRKTKWKSWFIEDVLAASIRLAEATHFK